MNILVTGGAGFIGSHLVEALVNLGHKVTVLDNFSTGRLENISSIKSVNLVECDIATRGSWEREFDNTEWVFHLAALADIVPSIQNPAAYFDANVNGTLNVLIASKNSNIKRFIYSASSSCYGLPDIFPTSEESKVAPEYPYALTKRLGEELVLHWCKVYKLPALSLRFFNVYGPKARTSGTYGAVFGVFLAQLLANKPLTIVGDGEQTRDFTYVSDVVSALICACVSKEVGEVYNVGSGRTVSINNLTKLLGATDIVYIPKRPGEPNCTFADISKIKKDLNWTPEVSIESGVKDMLRNKESWRDSPVWTPEDIAVATNEWFKYLSE